VAGGEEPVAAANPIATPTVNPTRTPTLALALLLALPAAAQDRPPEGELFGAPAPAEEQPRTGAGAAVATGRPAAEERVRRLLGETDDPLRIGGTLYLRAAVQAQEGTQPGHWPLSVPSLVDLFLDVRPSDRVRGFGLVRTFYDPTLSSPGLASRLQGPSQVGSTAQGATLQGLLDQLWLKFDAGHLLFFTAGKQHVKWGVGRFWSPTDFLHASRRNPLATFDDRTGTTMLKLHLPFERQGANLYALAIAERLVTRSPLVSQPQAAPTTDQLGAVGGGARAEVVLGGLEVGIDGVAQRGMRPRLGADFSTGIWEIDLRGEVAVRRGTDQPVLRDVGTGGAHAFELAAPDDLRTAAVAAAEWQHKYSDEDAFTLGVEYFWNQSGYADPHLYLPVLAAQLATPFYLGRHYAGAYLYLPKPGSWNLHSFTLSALGNLSDKSLIARLDWSVTVLTYLTFEAYLAGHLGARGGEFRFGLSGEELKASVPPALQGVCAGLGSLSGGICTIALPVATPAVDAGVALRVSL
jgi:hypothetical protein